MRFSVIVWSEGPMVGAYSSYQQELLDRVTELREADSLTFDAVAIRLCELGFTSPRGCVLQAEHVFSIYKKGKRRLTRLNAEPRYEFA